MEIESVILSCAPSYWDKTCKNFSTQIPINKRSGVEYQNIWLEASIATNFNKFEKICRYQNTFDLAQLIVREQLLIRLNESVNYYRVRRFTKVKKHYLSNALEYNLDYRRCGLPCLEFKKELFGVRDDDVILAVIVVTSKPESNVIMPENSSDFFIDYIIHV